jgi:hypothetical protein
MIYLQHGIEHLLLSHTLPQHVEHLSHTLLEQEARLSHLQVGTFDAGALKFAVAECDDPMVRSPKTMVIEKMRFFINTIILCPKKCECSIVGQRPAVSRAFLKCNEIPDTWGAAIMPEISDLEKD